jgi:nicotinamide-nucleotide amidase
VGELSKRVHELLESRGETVSSAESLTGGRLATVLTEVPGSSSTFKGGVVTYATEMKIEVLGVPQEVVDTHGVVSAECAEAMAEGVRMLTGATYGVSTTGVAGPAEQEGKPPGTVFIGLAGPEGVTSVALELDGERSEITQQCVDAAVAAFADALRQEETALG